MMLALHARVDVSLAPLELGNAFCDSKSELKIFEAALFGVPSIASPTRPYAAAMEAGVSGLLAATPSEWEAALERLIADAGLRARMGEAARLRAERDFADTEAAARFAGGLEAVPRRRRLSLCVMLPRGMARGVEAAGLDAALRRDVLALCRGLAVLGHKVVAAAGPQEPREGMAELRAALAESGVRLEHRPPRLPFDLVIATTPAALEPAMAQCEAVGGNPLRLAMTYEPWLHPVGEALLQAEASLEHVVPTIARTPFLARLLHGLHGVEAAHFDLAPDRTAFFPRPEVRREPLQVVALSRPGVAGSCHGLAMRALRLLRAREPRLDIVLLGSPAEAGLGEPLSRHGWPLHPDAAARFFSAGDGRAVPLAHRAEPRGAGDDRLRAAGGGRGVARPALRFRAGAPGDAGRRAERRGDLRRAPRHAARPGAARAARGRRDGAARRLAGADRAGAAAGGAAAAACSGGVASPRENSSRFREDPDVGASSWQVALRWHGEAAPPPGALCGGWATPS
jgi:hypothetical protein